MVGSGQFRFFREPFAHQEMFKLKEVVIMYQLAHGFVCIHDARFEYVNGFFSGQARRRSPYLTVPGTSRRSLDFKEFKLVPPDPSKGAGGNLDFCQQGWEADPDG